MVKRDELIVGVESILGRDLLLKAESIDEVANGVQFLGNEEVEQVSLGVSLNESFLDEAIAAGSNFCIFHHGFDPRTYKSRYTLPTQKRLRKIIQGDLTVAGYHYALDAHPEIGNNSTIVKRLGAKIVEPLFDEWGFVAEFDRPVKAEDLAAKCSNLFDHDVMAIYSDLNSVKRIGVVSGAAKPSDKDIQEMMAKGVELFITGEPSESVPHKMMEAGIHYFACGHYATEVFGVQELGKKIKEHFRDNLEVEFIDIPNIV